MTSFELINNKVYYSELSKEDFLILLQQESQFLELYVYEIYGSENYHRETEDKHFKNVIINKNLIIEIN